MKRQTFAICTLVAISAISTLSCRRSGLDGGQDKQIQISSAIVSSTASRAVANPAVELRDIRFLRKDDASGSLTSVNFTDVLPFSGVRAAGTEAAITFTPTQIYDIESNQSAYLLGYYPEGTFSEQYDNVTWTPDGATDVLMSNLYNAGNYNEPRSERLEFEHILTRIEVICAAKSGDGAREKLSWGKITSVKVKNIPEGIMFNYANMGLVTISGQIDFELLNGDRYTVGAFAPTDIQTSAATAVTASAMVATPFVQNELVLVVSSEKQPDIEVRVVLDDENKVRPGTVCRLRLNFDAILMEITPGSSSIKDWDDLGNSGDQDMGIPMDSYRIINGVKWATGNLVSVNSVPGGVVKGTGVKIGKPTDGGLYFQFGSLIGYKGGNAASKGTGRGIPHGATTTDPMPDTKYWSQAAAYSWANDAMVWPQAYTNGAAAWPSDKPTNDYYFGLGADPYNKMGQKLSAYLNWESGGSVNQSIAVGDPCRYYLGGGWRMPTAEDWGKLFSSVYEDGPVGGAWPGANADWGYGTATKTVMAGIGGSNSPTEGIGIYANTAATTEADAKADPGALFFPASGYRGNSNGSFNGVGRFGYYWSGSVYTATNGFLLSFSTTYVYPQNGNYRSFGFPVRCVQVTNFTTDVVDNTVPSGASTFTFNVSGLGDGGDSWTLKVDYSHQADKGFVASATSGRGDAVITVTVEPNPLEEERAAMFTLTTSSGFTPEPIIITQQPSEPWIEINGLKWAKGNLIADGPNWARIGAPTDGGLYFQFGSLVGWAGGAEGDGVGVPADGAPATPVLALQVKPATYSGTEDWATSGYYAGGTTAGDLLPATDDAAAGIGDPCRYYLKGTWRLPTSAEHVALWGTNPKTNGPWQPTPPGRTINRLFFPAVGYRYDSDGSINYVGSTGYYWSASTYATTYGYYLVFNSSNVYPEDVNDRRFGYGVRCVSQ